MKKMKDRVLAGFLALCLLAQTLCACTSGEPGTETAYETYQAEKDSLRQAFDDFADRAFREEIALNTLNLHYFLKNPADFGIEDYEITLGEASLESLQESDQDARTLLAELEEYPYDRLTEDQQVLYDALKDYLTVALSSEPYALYTEELSPTIGTQSQLPILMAEYAFYDEQDVEEYLALLALIPDYYQQLVGFEQQKSTNGLFMSDRAVDDIVKSCEAFLADRENHYLITTFDERLENLDDLSAEAKEACRERNREIFTEGIVPAYQNLIDSLTALKGTGLYEGGLCQYPDGKAYYEYLVQIGTGTRYSVDELKSRIESRINSQLLELSFRLQNSKIDTSRLDSFAFSLTDPEAILEDLKSKIGEDFPAIPDTAYTVKTVPESLEDTLSPAFYLTPPLDDPSDNVIYINEGQLDDSTLYSTLAHEGYPGHLYQTVYAASRGAHPLLSLLSCSGYTEGWATYVEYYAYELDDGVDSRIAKMLSLNSSITLGIYAMADIGINYDGWTLSDTALFLNEWFGGVDQATLETFYYTMVEEPANYLNYYVGYLEILLFREEAEEVLDDDFDLKEFHTFLLDMSGCSFRVIEDYFDDWLSERMPETRKAA